MAHKVTLLPGEGIGPEVSRATCKILAAAGVQIDWEEIDARAAANAEAGQVLNETAVESVRRNGVGLKARWPRPLPEERAASTSPFARPSTFTRISVRQELPGVKSASKNVDVVIVAKIPKTCTPDWNTKWFPEWSKASKSSPKSFHSHCALCFRVRQEIRPQEIHAIHKANIMKLSDGLFLKSIRVVAAEYPEIEYKEMIVDNACMQIVMNPQQFDVLLLPNLMAM